MFDQAIESQCPAQPIQTANRRDAEPDAVPVDFDDRKLLHDRHVPEHVFHGPERLDRLDTGNGQLDRFGHSGTTDRKLGGKQVGDIVDHQFGFAVPGALIAVEVEAPAVALRGRRPNAPHEYRVGLVALRGAQQRVVEASPDIAETEVLQVNRVQQRKRNRQQAAPLGHIKHALAQQTVAID